MNANVHPGLGSGPALVAEADLHSGPVVAEEQAVAHANDRAAQVPSPGLHAQVPDRNLGVRPRHGGRGTRPRRRCPGLGCRTRPRPPCGRRPPSAPRCTTAAPPSPLPAPGLAPPRCTAPPSTPLWKTAALDTQVSGRGPDLDTLMSGPALAAEDIILATQVSNAAPDPGLLVDHGAADGGEPPPVANILTF